MMFAVRLPVLLRLLFDMYGVMALLTLVPTLVAILDGSSAGTRYLAVAALLGLCWALGRLLDKPTAVQKNEALATVALLYISASLLFSFPIMAYDVPFTDAWFEAVSGVTTTGLSTLAVDGKPAAFLFGRGWMQWVGGIGVVVLALAFIIPSGATASKLGFGKREMDDLVGGTRAHAKRVVIVYLVITALGIGALLLAGASLLDAVVHCMAAVSTGGFANYPDSLGSLGAWQLGVINVLCVAGAISFHVYYRSLLYSRKVSLADNQLYTMLSALVLGFCVLWLLCRLAALQLAPGDIFTLVVSSQTTAGFSSVDLAMMPAWLLLLLCVAMLVGGGLGSTSGGLKLGRALLLLKLAKMAVMRTAVPEKVYVSADAGAARFDARDVEEVLALATWFGVVLFISWSIFVFYGYPPVAALFEVSSALATAGLSAGITGADLPPFLKFVLCCNMLFGRVELLAILVLLSPRSWIGRRRGRGRRER